MNSGLYWITGGTSGIGLATAEELASKNQGVILSSRSGKAKESQLVQRLKDLGASDVQVVNMDMLAPLASEGIAKILDGKKLHGLVLNAGSPKSGPIAELTSDDFRTANDLILTGPREFLLNCLPYFESQNASVVAITSTSVKEPVMQLNLSAIYRTAWTVCLKLLSSELASKGIRFNTVGPGVIATDHLMNLIEKGAKAKGVPVEQIEEVWKTRSVMNRIGKPEEIARVIRFLLSEESSFVNGQTLMVDGNSTRSYF